MSGSLHETGLPAWLLTPRMAVMGGIGFAVVVSVIVSAVSFLAGVFDSTNLNSAPACFMIVRPIKPGTAAFDHKSFDAGRVAGEHSQTIAKVQEAEPACQVGACPPAARETYRTAVRGYLMARTSGTSKLTYEYGEAGLNYARWVYEEDADRAVIMGLRHRYAAGLFDLKRMDNGGHDYILATRMLLFGDPQAFRPCLAD